MGARKGIAALAVAMAALTLITRAAAAAPGLPPNTASASPPDHRVGAAPLAPRNALCGLHTPPAGLCDRFAASTAATGATPAGEAAPAAVDAWSIVDSPNVPGGLRTHLLATACASASDCWAVGEQLSATDYSSALAEHWDGASWTVAAAPSPGDAIDSTLSAVACPSASDCWATGLYSVNGGDSAPLVEHWDGASWTLVSAPQPGGAQYGGLRGLSCVSGSDCWAVGWSNGTNGFQTLIERWNGTSWTLVAAAPADPNAWPSLNDVACSAASDCWAVGASTPSTAQALVEHWNGTAWTAGTAATPSTAQSTSLTGVACVSASMCVAVGSYTLAPAGTSQALIEQFDGASWTVMTPSDASPATAATLVHVTCLTRASCYAAGSGTPAGGAGGALVEAWNGSSWSSAGATGPSGAQSSVLSGIACGAGACWAVGSQVTGGGFDSGLVEQLAAAGWGAHSTPVPQGRELNDLSAVACAGGARCFAVGAHSTEAEADTLVDAWTGDGWTAMASPSVGGGMDSFLNGVTCLSASDCWAVGDVQPSSNGPKPTNVDTATTLIESWNGFAWSIVGSPNPTGAQISVLTGVSCASATACFAVGYVYPFANNGATIGLSSTGPVAVAQTLIEQWNGQSWTVVGSPNANPELSDALASITCVSATDCWAVGAAEGAQTYEGLVERWNGSAWSVVTSPQTSGNESSGLFGVACAAASACWSVGYSYLGSGASAKDFQTWVERWDGAAWSAVASPNLGADQVDALFAVTCASMQDCRAVGTYGDGPRYATLALQWDGSVWQIAPSDNPAVTLGTSLYGVACTTGAACWSAGSYNVSDGTLQTLVEQSGGAPVPQVPDAPWAWLLLVAAIPGAVACRRALQRLHDAP